MSQYENFVEDFPMRCKYIYDELYFDALKLKKEVTFLFMVASASILVPFERIRPTHGDDPTHPSEDTKKFKKNSDRLKILLDKNFKKSSLWSTDCNNWRYGESAKITFDPNRISENELNEIPSHHKVETIMCIIRNALAHGNIYTIEDPIKYMYFVSWIKREGKTIGTKYIRITPLGLNILLNQWITFLSNKKIDGLTVGSLLNKISNEESTTQYILGT